MRFGFGMLVGFCRCIPGFSHFEKTSFSDYKETYFLHKFFSLSRLSGLQCTMADFEQLETRRLELESNVAKLRKSLQHWRTWDAEYEGLKEELSSGVNVQSEKDCVSSCEAAF
jgi:hypothetical protein